MASEEETRTKNPMFLVGTYAFLFYFKIESKENCEEVVDTLLTKWVFCCDKLLSDLVREIMTEFVLGLFDFYLKRMRYHWQATPGHSFNIAIQQNRTDVD